MADEVIPLFPVPFLRAPGALGRPLVAALVNHFGRLARHDNNSSPRLSHTELLKPSDSPLFVEAAALISPKLVDFGALLFGQRLGWSVKGASRWPSTPSRPGSTPGATRSASPVEQWVDRQPEAALALQQLGPP